MGGVDKQPKTVYQCFYCRKAFQDEKFLMKHFSGKHYESFDEVIFLFILELEC